MSGDEDREIGEIRSKGRLTKTKVYKKPYRSSLVYELIKYCVYV